MYLPMILGISGLSSDFRDIEEAASKDNKKNQIALETFTYGVKKYIGAYIAVLGGKVDAIVFTAGVGENSDIIREMVLKDLDNLGIILDKEANKVQGKEAEISKPESKVKVLVIPTNEELMIARETLALVGKH